MEMTTDGATSVRMSKQLSKNTAPELNLRKAVRDRGFGYRLEWPIPGMRRRRCDFAFVGAKVAVFVDGCFWHSCPIYGSIPKSNRDWWAKKLARNRERDLESDRALQVRSWLSIRIWEHEDPIAAADMIVSIVAERRLVQSP